MAVGGAGAASEAGGETFRGTGAAPTCCTGVATSSAGSGRVNQSQATPPLTAIATTTINARKTVSESPSASCTANGGAGGSTPRSGSPQRRQCSRSDLMRAPHSAQIT